MQDADQTPFRAIDDIGLRLPFGMTPPVDAELEAMVKRLAGVTRGAGLVMAAREIAADPSSTLRTVLALLKLLVFGRAQQTIDEVTAGATRLGCKSGCAWCCHRSVEATIPEAILVAAHLADPADPRRRRILENAERFRGLDERERRRTGTPCALLAEDNTCSVHDDRPLICRAMMATDAEGCRQAHLAALEGEDSPVELFLNAQYVIRGDQAGMRGILRDMGLQDDSVELTQAVAAILRDPALVDRWLERERVFGPELAPPLLPEAEAVPAQATPA
jgi:Fe-S-cluster containining protein